jgi:hypothetical protein
VERVLEKEVFEKVNLGIYLIVKKLIRHFLIFSGHQVDQQKIFAGLKLYEERINSK